MVKPAEALATAGRQLDGAVGSVARLVAFLPRAAGSFLRPLQNGLAAVLRPGDGPRAGRVPHVGRGPVYLLTRRYRTEMDDLGSLNTFVPAVPAVPLVAAAVCGLLPGGVAARRFATWIALIHLAFVCGLVFVATQTQDQRALELRKFTPFAVPGAMGTNNSVTTYDLFPVGPSSAGKPAPAVQFFLGLDGFNLPLIVLTCRMTLFVVLVTGPSITDRSWRVFRLLFALEAFCLAAFLSFDASCSSMRFSS